MLFSGHCRHNQICHRQQWHRQNAHCEFEYWRILMIYHFFSTVPLLISIIIFPLTMTVSERLSLGSELGCLPNWARPPPTLPLTVPPLISMWSDSTQESPSRWSLDSVFPRTFPPPTTASVAVPPIMMICVLPTEKLTPVPNARPPANMSSSNTLSCNSLKVSVISTLDLTTAHLVPEFLNFTIHVDWI